MSRRSSLWLAALPALACSPATPEAVVAEAQPSPDPSIATPRPSASLPPKPPIVQPHAACCAALEGEANAAPPDRAEQVRMAAAICRSTKPDESKAVLAVLTILGPSLPAACR